MAWVCRLRAEGRRVYLVTVSGRRVRGSYGVALEPDISLDEALGLAAQASLIIIPCAIDALHPFSRDPRLDELLLLAGEAGTQFLANPSAQESIAKLVPGAVLRALEMFTPTVSLQSEE